VSSTVKLACIWAILATTIALGQSNPVPFIDQPLVPMSVAPGGSGFTLTMNGAGFTSSSVVNWSGIPLATTFVSKAQVTATVAASDIASPHTAWITVANPTPGGGISNVAYFQIASPAPTVVVSAPSPPFVNGELSNPIVADFNNDGKLDIAINTFDSQNNLLVSIVLGNGDGTFQAPVNYILPNNNGGQGPQIVTGDFNGDGKLDLVVSSNVFSSILLGNGDGTFQSPVSLPANLFPIVAGDFNGDGKLDLAGLENEYTDVLVMLGNGDGTFQPLTPFPSELPVGQSFAGLLTADFHGAGVLDLAVLDASDPRGGGATIFQGNGDGTFHLTGTCNTQDDTASFFAADFNGDGKQDIAFDYSLPPNQGFAVTFGDGNGMCTSSTNTLTSTFTPSQLVVGDFNDDGKLDLGAGGTPNTLENMGIMVLGNGDGTFQAPFYLPGGSEILAVGDFNGDGRLDFVNGSTSGHELTLLLQIVAPVVQSSPSSLNFPTPQLIGTNSSPQVTTLTNIGDAGLKIASIAISGADASDFTQTNNCGSMLAVNATCQVRVTFSPTGGGTRTANVQITDNALGSPQAIALTGTSQDFSLAMAPGTTTVTPGQAGNYTLTLSPLNGFSETVTLSCSGTPPQSTCAFTPSSVTLNGSSNATANVAVVTSGTSARLIYPGSALRSGLLALWLVPLSVGLVVLGKSDGSQWRPRLLRVVALICLSAVGAGISSCGGGGGSSGNGTPPGTYTVSVSGTFTSGSAKLTHIVEVTLVVQ